MYTNEEEKAKFFDDIEQRVRDGYVPPLPICQIVEDTYGVRNRAAFNAHKFIEQGIPEVVPRRKSKKKQTANHPLEM